jgi:hypothetical protein
MNHIPHFPLPILTHNGDLIIAAAGNHPEIASRLTGGYMATATALLGKVTSDVSGQRKQKGDIGNLTKDQRAALDVLQLWMNQARKTAKLAFVGQTVKLHQAFQVGVAGPYDLRSFLNRADIILASVQDAGNLAELKNKGWSDADTAAFVAARKAFGTVDEAKQQAKSGGKDSTTTKNADAASLYDSLLTIQNAADLQWPATDPANAGVRDEFCLNTFPPTSGSGTSQPTPAPTPTPTPQTGTSTK